MADFKLRISLGDASVELEGEGVLVKEILEDLKVSGLGALAKTNIVKKQEEAAVKKIESTDDNAVSVTEAIEEACQYPVLDDLLLGETIKNEQERILVFAFYISNYGEGIATEEAIRAKYDETGFWPKAASNFKTNLRKLIGKKKYLQSRPNGYILTSEGKAEAERIIFDKPTESTTKKSKSAKLNKNSIPKYDLINLNFTTEEKRSLLELFSQNSNINKVDTVALASEWYNKNRQSKIVNKDIIFTILRTANVPTAFSIPDALRNAKKKNYFQSSSKRGDYELTHLGEDHVNFEILKQE